MSNDFYNASGSPATGSPGSSSTMRAEFGAIKDAFDKLPALGGNANRLVVVNSVGSALVASGQALPQGDLVGTLAEQTLTNKTLDSITNHVGANHIHYKVKANENLVKGNVVKVVGYNLGLDAMEVTRVTSASDIAVGVVYSNISNGNVGPIINTGILEGIDTSTFPIGTILYPNTSGGFTSTKPTTGDYQALAFVVRSHASNGTILIEASEPAPVINSAVRTFLAAPTSANLAAAVTGETGSGALVFGTNPTISGGTISGGDNISAANGLGFRNRIINGDMRIDQRNAGASVTITNTGAVTYTLDRYYAYGSQASKFSVQQNAGAVTPPTGFSNYFGVTSLSAYSLADDVFELGQKIEGFNTADLAWGTASAAAVTLSFWVRSSLTGTFGGSLRNATPNRSYPFTYTVSAANTWEQKTITVPGDTTGTWLTTNGVGIGLSFGLGVGSEPPSTSQASNSKLALSPRRLSADRLGLSWRCVSGILFFWPGETLDQPFKRAPLFAWGISLCQFHYAVTQPYPVNYLLQTHFRSATTAQ